jgi:hypothetical protein
MTNARSKNEVLGETAKSYCKMWLMEELYNRTSEFKSKYTDKGNDVEDDSIDFAGKILNWGMVFHNDEFKENDFLTGTCDIALPNMIVDMKNAFSWTSFPLFEEKPKDKNNIWQLQGYMELYEKAEARIVYTLMDTPDDIIQREVSYASNNKEDGSELTETEINEIVKNHKYNDVPDYLKIRAFDIIKRDPDLIKKVEERVVECRKYIDTLLMQLENTNSKFNLNK